MRRRSALMWFVLFMMMFALASGGCGGGGGSSSGQYTPNTPVTPAEPNTPVTPTPDDPDTPVTPDPDEPKEPDEPDVSESFIEIPKEQVLLENAVFNPDIHTVSAEEILSSTYSDPDNDKLRGISPTQVTVSSESYYEIGGVMAVQPSADSKYGFSAVVEEVMDNPDGSRTLILRQALLPDILTDGDLFFSFGKTPEEFAESYGGESARSVIKQGRSNALAWYLLWDLVIKPQIDVTGELKENIISENWSISESATMKAKFFDFIGFETSGKLSASLKMDVDAFISIEKGELKKIALGFPVQFSPSAELSFEATLSKKADLPITPLIPIPSAPIPVGPCVIPTFFVLEGLLSLEAGVDSKIGYSVDAVYNGGLGYWWELESGFHEIDYQNKWTSASGGPIVDEFFDDAFFEFGVGPKFSYSIGIPEAKVISASGTAGAEVNFNFDGISNLDAKFKSKFSVDLLTALMGLLPSSVVKTDFSETREFKYNIIPGSDPTTPSTPATDDGVTWASVADTSWYSPYKTEFEISNARQLAGLAKLVNETRSGALHDAFSGKTVRMTASINLAGRKWTPIGGYNLLHFIGTFDGGGGTIANMTVDIESTSYVYAGLFGINSGTIKDVNLSDFSILVSSFSTEAGGLVGSNQGLITNCAALGNVSAYASNAASVAGGLVGSNNIGTIENNCTASGSVFATSTSTSSLSGGSYAGGLVGYNGGTIKNNCTASGSVSATFISTSPYYSCAGGFVGYNYHGTIESCTALGTDISAVSEMGDEYAHSGGFIGWFHSGTLSGVNSAALSPAIGLYGLAHGPSDNI